MKYLIGTDIGTSGTKTIIMDTQGNLISSDLQEYDVLTPRNLWAEQWPEVWVDAVKRSIRNAKNKTKCNPEDIKGICISGLYGGSGIPLDENMNPVRPCLIWMDRRAEVEQKWIENNIDLKRLYEISHNGTDPYYGYTKILWIKNYEPENWAKTKLFLPPNAYVIYKLTGDIAIDYSSAGNIGGIFDQKKRAWSEEMMGAMGIPRSMMPERIVESSDIVGGLTSEAAKELGLQEGTPVCAGGVDCVVATLGLGVFEPGCYVAAIGTSMCAALVHDHPINAKGLIEMPYVKDASRLSYSSGGVATSGALLKWFRDNFARMEKLEEDQGGENAYQALDKAAADIAPGSDGLIVLPYFMGERSPVWDVNARGNIFGLTLYHTSAHVYRAFLEAVAYSLRHSMESANTELGDYILVAGGVAKSKLWRQIIADVTGYPIVCPINDVEANLGDVILAGVGTGLLDYSKVKDWQVLGDKIMPNKKAHEIYSKYYKLYHSIYAHLKEDMEQIAELGKTKDQS